ncbi:MAG: hypothetical protein KDJ27_21320 [Gammaproteobacteria bacterium]|nr:hypothetical protein [Gammaproteobacteria bacterium]
MSWVSKGLWFVVWMGMSLPSSAAGDELPTQTASDAPAAKQLEAALAAQGWTVTTGTEGERYYWPPPTNGKAAERSLADQLRRQLEIRGWERVEGPDGGLVFRLPHAAVATAPAQTDLSEQLRAQLEALGWTASEAGDGSVDYRPPPPREAPATSMRLADDLRAQLEAAGWTCERQADGTLILRRPTPAGAVPAADDDLAAQLRAQLKARGWIEQPGEEGDVFFRRPDDAARLQPPVLPPADIATDLRRQLQSQGWQRSQGADGSQIYRWSPDWQSTQPALAPRTPAAASRDGSPGALPSADGATPVQGPAVDAPSSGSSVGEMPNGPDEPSAPAAAPGPTSSRDTDDVRGVTDVQKPSSAQHRAVGEDAHVAGLGDTASGRADAAPADRRSAVRSAGVPLYAPRWTPRPMPPYSRSTYPSPPYPPPARYPPYRGGYATPWGVPPSYGYR